MKHIFAPERIKIESEVVDILGEGGVNANGSPIITQSNFQEYSLKGVWSANNGAIISGLTPGANDATGPERVHL